MRDQEPQLLKNTQCTFLIPKSDEGIEKKEEVQQYEIVLDALKVLTTLDKIDTETTKKVKDRFMSVVASESIDEKNIER